MKDKMVAAKSQSEILRLEMPREKLVLVEQPHEPCYNGSRQVFTELGGETWIGYIDYFREARCEMCGGNKGFIWHCPDGGDFFCSECFHKEYEVVFRSVDGDRFFQA